MKTQAEGKFEVTDFLDEEHRELRVVILFENRYAGKHGLHCVTELLEQTGDGTDMVPMIWSFDLLQQGEWRELAAKDIATSDMLVIATDLGTMPPAVRQWLAQTLQRLPADSSVVYLSAFTAHDEAQQHDLQFVRHLAEQIGLRFFTPETPARQHSIPIAFDARMVPTHWGLNE